MRPARRTRVGTMDIKICGHKVRWRKPIKIYTLLKASSAILVLCLLMMSPSMAAEPSSVHAKQSSPCAAVSCIPFQENDMTNAPATKIKPQHKPRRPAGKTTMSPALAMAMTFGVRSVQGPVEHSQPVAVRRGMSPAIAKQTRLLLSDESRKKSSMNVVALRLALGD